MAKNAAYAFSSSGSFFGASACCAGVACAPGLAGCGGCCCCCAACPDCAEERGATANTAATIAATIPIPLPTDGSFIFFSFPRLDTLERAGRRGGSGSLGLVPRVARRRLVSRVNPSLRSRASCFRRAIHGERGSIFVHCFVVIVFEIVNAPEIHMRPRENRRIVRCRCRILLPVRRMRNQAFE